MSGSPISKKAIALILALPVAALLGYMLAGPLDMRSIAVYGGVLGVILLPLIVQYHHAMVVLSFNATIDIFFLPGKPHLWMLLALISLVITLISRLLDKEMRLIHVPSVTWTLLAMLILAAITAKFTGGFGMRAMGTSTYGGKRYVFIVFAFLIYLAISLHPVPLAKARTHIGYYFLSNVTAVLSNLIYFGGPNLWVLYLFFPVDYALTQAYDDYSVGLVGMKASRLAGLAPAAQAVVCFMLAQYGIRGVLDLARPWRLLIVVGTIALSLLSGFRSGVIFIGLILGIQFCLEGLLRTRLFAAVVLTAILGFAALIPFSQQLPLTIQRSLSMLPIDVDPAVRVNTAASTEWRLQMWDLLVPQIPKYFWFGKGYFVTETDYYLATESVRRGLIHDFELALLAGDYHNGPLSIILPFGIWGVLAFLAFLIAATRVFYLNYRHGNPALHAINTLLFAYFLARTVQFLFVFGQVHTELGMLAALVGLSVSLNGGVARATAPAALAAQKAQPQPQPPAPTRWRPARA